MRSMLPVCCARCGQQQRLQPELQLELARGCHATLRGQRLAAGVDDCDSYQALCRFIRVVSTHSAVTHFIIHARKCLLKGLSPRENRTIPPLRCVK